MSEGEGASPRFERRNSAPSGEAPSPHPLPARGARECEARGQIFTRAPRRRARQLKEISQSKDMAYDNAIYDKGSSLKKLEDEETNLRAKLNFATRTKAEEIEKQTPSVYAKSEYQGPPIMGVDKKAETKEEKPKVEAPIVEPEKPKLASFPGNDTNKISGSFNVYNLDAYISGKHLTTPAEKITIPGFEEYNFFIAQTYYHRREVQ